MPSKLFGSMLVAAVIATSSASDLHPQINKGYTDVGAVIGFGGIGSASLSLGGRFEHIFKELPDLGGGRHGIEVSADSYSYSASDFKLSDIPVGATANYHFKLDNKKIDPFIGLTRDDRDWHARTDPLHERLSPAMNNLLVISS